MSDVKGDAGSPLRRRYHSPKRAQAALERRRRMRMPPSSSSRATATSRRQCSASRLRPASLRRRFYLAYPSKAALLSEIIRVAVRGGEGDQPLTRRAPWTEMLAAASVPEVVATSLPAPPR